MKLRELMKKETIRRLRIVEELYYTNDYLSSEQLLDKVNCTLPVLISDVRFLNSENLQFRISKNKGLYSIDFDDSATIDSVYANILRSNLEYQTIESAFFEENERIDTAAKRLNCSFSNMQRYLKAINTTLAEDDIALLYRPIRIAGDELAIRRFYYLFFKESRVPFSNYRFSNRLVNAVDQLIRQIMNENNITNTMNSHFQLMHSFLIALHRLKNAHPVERLSSNCGLAIPKAEALSRLGRFIRQETEMELTEAVLRECLWPLFSHHLILSRHQQAAAHKIDNKLADFYDLHMFLLQKLNALLDTPLSHAEMAETTRLLGNELFCYYPNKYPIEILQETERMLLNLIDKKYSRELNKLRRIVNEFLTPLDRETLAPLYLSCLITMIENIFQRLVASDKPLNVLLLSDTSTTHERFWQSIFPVYIKGSVNYEYFETPFILQEQLTNLTKKYDLIVTNVTMTGLESACPLIAINAYPTAKDFERIQQFVNQFESLSKRKELYDELKTSS